MPPDPNATTVLQFATSILNTLSWDPDALVRVNGGDPMEAWVFLTEKILAAVDELEILLEKNK